MLSDAAREVIRRYGIATLHDYRTISPVSGEPFFEDGILAYYDGRTLLACAQPLRNAVPPAGDTIRAYVRRWITEQPLESLMVVGNVPVALADIVEPAFKIDGIHRRIERSAELFLRAGAYRNGGGWRRAYSRAKRNGLAARVLRGSIVEARHITLIEHFYRRYRLSQYLAETALMLPGVMTSPETTIIEAWDDQALRGFVAVHEPFDAVSIPLFIVHDGVTPGVSDFLYAQLIDHAGAVHSTFVNVGPSATVGQYRFKLKWHAIPLVSPYYATTWRRRGAPKTAHHTWLLRILDGGS